MAAFRSTNIANTLLQTLHKLTAQGENLSVSRETIKPVQTLVTVCNILVDSAETVAESSRDPDARNRTFDFATKIRGEIKMLELIRRLLETNPSDPSIRSKLLNCARNIATYTSMMIASQDDAFLTRVVDACKQCADHAKELISSTGKTYEQFFDACKNFGGASLTLAKILQEMASKIEDRVHQQKVISAYNSIKEIGPQMIRAAKRGYENPNVVEVQQEMYQVSRQLASKISYAISVAQSDGGKVLNELSATSPTIPLPPMENENQHESQGRRRRTVREPTQGNEILKRAQTAVVARELGDTLEQASLLQLRNAEQLSFLGSAPAKPPAKEPAPPTPSAPSTPSYTSVTPPVNSYSTPGRGTQQVPSLETPIDLDDEAESIIINLEQELQNSYYEETNDDQWKTKYEEAEKQMNHLKEENALLLEENENLNRVIESLKKRLAFRT